MQPESAPVACITGASSGIGAALSLELAARGFRLLLMGRDQHRLGEIAEEATKMGGQTQKV